MILIGEEIKNNLYENNVTSFFLTILNNEYTESLAAPVFVFMQFFTILFCITMLSIFLFSFFGSHTTDENLIDHDYTLNTLLIESEEEIGSLDDMFMAGLIFFFVFG